MGHGAEVAGAAGGSHNPGNATTSRRGGFVQGAAPISRLHREAIPFLGMAASVVVVVQVLIMEAFVDLALRLLFQARVRLTILVCL